MEESGLDANEGSSRERSRRFEFRTEMRPIGCVR